MINIIKAISILFGTITGVAGGYVMGNLYPEYKGALGLNTDIKLAAILGGLGYLIFSLLFREFETWLQKWVKDVDLKKAVIGALGAIMGLVISNLFLLFPLFLILNQESVIKALGEFSFLVPLTRTFLPLIFNLLGFYIGMYLLLKKQADIMKGLMDIFNSHSSQRNRDIRILDSSVIIDGRAADIISSGFMPGKILIPRFVLMELQLIADSSNSLKRNKGRRGLDIVDRLIKDFPSDVSVYYGDIETVKDVDEKLVELCKFLNATLVTTDLNLNKVAKIQGIPVMNVNELSNAVKPMFIPGDQITINIVKDGKEPKQGIGYLNDGTMVIVENGRVYIGKTVSVIVNSVMQTSAGRLVFSNVDFEVTAENPPESNSPESNTGESNIEVNIESDTEIRSKSINESINKPNNESNLDIKTNHNYNGNDFNVKKYNGNKYKGTEKKEKNLKEKNLAEGVNNEYSGPNINKKTKKKRGCKK